LVNEKPTAARNGVTMKASNKTRAGARRIASARAFSERALERRGFNMGVTPVTGKNALPAIGRSTGRESGRLRLG